MGAGSNKTNQESQASLARLGDRWVFRWGNGERHELETSIGDIRKA